MFRENSFQKTTKRFISLLLCFMVQAFCMPMFAFTTAAADSNVLDSGSGTDGDPYLIHSLGQLEAITNYPGACFRLETDITGAVTEPICSLDDPFTGKFNGNEHQVAVSIVGSSGYAVGLFASNSGVIWNLKITGSVSGSADNVAVGAVAGYNAGSISGCVSSASVSANGSSIVNSCVGGIVGYNTSNVSGCSSSGAVSSHTASGTVYEGGLLGYNTGSVLNSSASGAVTTAAPCGDVHKGGLIGYSSGANITGCFASGDVPASPATDDQSDEGGLIGYAEGAGFTILGCYATGNVTGGAGSRIATGGLIARNYQTAVSDCYATGTITTAQSAGTLRMGGLIGYNQYAAVSKCYAKGNVSGSAAAAYIGGLVGSDHSEETGSSGSYSITQPALISDSHASGNVTFLAPGTATCFIGGLVGSLSTTSTNGLSSVTYAVTNCYSTGNVTDQGGSADIGGLMGFIQAVSAHLSFSTGNVTATTGTNAGGLIGYERSNSVFENCYETGNVYAANIPAGSSANLAGLVGNLNGATIRYCYSSGDVVGNNANKGGINGSSGGTVNGCYWNTDFIGNSQGGSTSAVGTGLSTSQMTGNSTRTTMAKLDFTATWSTSAGCYPQLSVFSGSADSSVQSDSLKSATVSSAATVVVSPAAAVVEKSKLQAFTAVVSGLNNPTQTVNWSVSGNSSSGTFISSSGVLTVALDETAQSITVTAASKLDSSVKGTATVTMKAPQTDFTGGTGISGDPFIITTLAQLKEVSSYPGGYFKLGANITDALTTPLCSINRPFTGNFDGAGHSVNISVTNASGTYVGLFSYVGSTGVICNLNVLGSVSSTLTGGSSTLYTGALAGYNCGKILNRVSSADVSATNSFMNHIGGLAGYNTGTISGSSAGGAVTANNKANVGGLVGTNYSTNTPSDGGSLTNTALIENCHASGAVLAKAANSGIGGLVGQNLTAYGNSLASQTNVVRNSYATGNVTETPGSEYIGGLVGYNQVVSISGCYSTGNVSATANSNVGGFVGFTTGLAYLSDCHSTGKVSAAGLSSSANVGGFLGKLNNGTLTNDYVMGNAAISNLSGGSCYLGGLVGLMRSGTVGNCFSAGNVSVTTVSGTAAHAMGGLIGYMNAGTVGNVYSTGDISGTGLTSNTAFGGLIGGMAGGTLSGAYEAGAVSGPNARLGGLIGMSRVTPSGCYWNKSDNPAGTLGTGMTKNQMTGTGAATNLSGLDYSSGFAAAANDALKWYYPQLKVFSESDDPVIKSASLASVTVNNETAITDFKLGGYSGTVNEADHTVSVTVPEGTDVTNMAPTVTISAGALLTPASGTPQNFTHPVTYTVKAKTGGTQAYTVPVTFAKTVNLAAIGITAPSVGETPKGSVPETVQYTGTVSWSPSDSTFASAAVYTATVTLTPKAGYTLAGVPENFFTVSGAQTVSNSKNSGVITVVFPETPNRAPTAKQNIPVQNLMAGKSSGFTAADLAEDADGDSIAITAIVTSPDAGIATAELNSGTVTVHAVAEGSTSVALSVSDGKGGAVTISVPIKVTTVSNVKITFSPNPFKEILNAVSFGVFYHDTVDAGIQSESGSADYYEYQIISDGGTFNPNGTWAKGNSFSVSPDFKGRIYARGVYADGELSPVACKALVTDKTKPEITASYDSSAATISVLVKDNGAGLDTITYQVGPAPVQTIHLTPSDTKDISTVYRFTIGNLPNGKYDVIIHASDNSGNEADAKTVSALPENDTDEESSAPTLPSHVEDTPSQTSADLSGAAFPNIVTKVRLTAVQLTPGGVPALPGAAAGAPDSQAAAVYNLTVLNRGLSVIGSPVLYRIELLDQDGNPATFSGSVLVKIPIPSGLRGTPHVFRYEADGSFTDMNAVAANGFLSFHTTHFSYYAVAGTGNSIALDTTSYEMPIGGHYQIGMKLTGDEAALVKIYSANSRAVSAVQLKNGNIQVTGNTVGTAWIMIDVYDAKNRFLTHASVRVDVRENVLPKGKSKRQIGIF